MKTLKEKQEALKVLIARIELDHSKGLFGSYREYRQELDQAESELSLLKYNQFAK